MTRTHLLCICLLLVCAQPVITRGADADQVNAAMSKAQQWLLANQKNGNWENWQTDYQAQKTGWTALALDALLAGGTSPLEPSMVSAIKYLESTPTDGVYALGLRMQVWARLPASKEVHQAAMIDAMKLVNGIGRKGAAAGMWGYVAVGGGYSHSRSQYGVLGVAAARQMGIEIPDALWSLLKHAWLDHQVSDGGWTYTKEVDNGHPTTAGMTTAGVASLFLVEEALHSDESLDCRGNVKQPQLDNGLKWMAQHSNEIANGDATPRNYPFAALYGVERVGASGGIKYFGTVDWYRKGTDWLLKNQGKDGNWEEMGSDDYTMSKFVNTCLATLFLAHGRAPIFMEKLDYSTDPAKPAAWNQRPRDVANLAHHTGAELEQELNWEVVTLASPVADYHDAPILYLSGHDPIKLTDDGKAKLKEFIDGGGMIVANADCGGIGFANSFHKLATEITPYEFRNLPKDHPIYTRQQYPASRWKTKPNLLGLSNGIRELMILIPNGDPGKTWELNEVKGREGIWELGADLFEYVASRKHLRSRGESYVVQRDDTITATATVKIGRLQYGGNWNPEPGGWTRLSNIMHNRLKIDLALQTVQSTAPITGVTVVHLTGTQNIHLTDDARKHLVDFVNGGGTLIVDAAGGSGDFAGTIRGDLLAAFKMQFTRIPPDDALYGSDPVKPITVRYRAFATETRGSLNQPRIEAMHIGNRYAVFFSADDLSAGLVGQQVDGIIGYDPDSATDIMDRMIQYSQKK
jgi:hypothetical protein